MIIGSSHDPADHQTTGIHTTSSNLRYVYEILEYAEHGTNEEKVEAIRALQFPSTLGALENYLGLTEWLRQYVSYYA